MGAEEAAAGWRPTGRQVAWALGVLLVGLTVGLARRDGAAGVVAALGAALLLGAARALLRPPPPRWREDGGAGIDFGRSLPRPETQNRAERRAERRAAARLRRRR